MTINVFDVFKSLSDATRHRLVGLLLSEGELCVRELTHALDLSQPKISRHLAQLRQAKILVDRRNGTWIYYQINSQLPVWALDIIKVACSTPNVDDAVKSDLNRLKAMSDRPAHEEQSAAPASVEAVA